MRYLTTILIIVLTAIFFLFLLKSCESYDEKDFYFTEQEKSVISAFKINDTIIYESTKKDIDTILITEIERQEQKNFGYFVSPVAHNRINVQIRYLPLPLLRSLSDSTLRAMWRTSPIVLVSISKSPQSKTSGFYVRYKGRIFNSKGFGFLKNIHRDTLIINGITLTNYYKLKTEKLLELLDIEYFYWTIEKGLAAYECSDGTFWVRKN